MKLILMLIPALCCGVTITDTIKHADGSNANGRVIIALTRGTHSSAATYAATRKAVTVTDGAFMIDLAANTTLTPAGTYYRVEYLLRDGTQQTEYWNVPTGGPYTIRDVRWRPREPLGYIASFSGTTWSLPASVHGIRSTGLTASCYDLSTPMVALECAITVHPTTFDVTARFATSQAGHLVLNAVSAWSTQNYVKSITTQTSVSIPYSEHKFATNRLQVQCYDNATPAAEVECAWTVNSSTYAVAVSFAVAQSGFIVVSGR
jgi:hypothetical protein